MVDNIVECLSNIKSQYELKSLDFESGCVAWYTEKREAMAALYDEENFGPQKLAEMRDEADPNNYKTLITDQKKYENRTRQSKAKGTRYSTRI